MKVQITIRGRQYTVRSDEEDVDLQEIALYVDRGMADVAQRAATFDDYTVAMLAAMNIASDYARFRTSLARELGELDRELASTAVLLEATVPEEPAS